MYSIRRARARVRAIFFRYLIMRHWKIQKPRPENREQRQNKNMRAAARRPPIVSDSFCALSHIFHLHARGVEGIEACARFRYISADGQVNNMCAPVSSAHTHKHARVRVSTQSVQNIIRNVQRTPIRNRTHTASSISLRSHNQSTYTKLLKIFNTYRRQSSSSCDYWHK